MSKSTTVRNSAAAANSAVVNNESTLDKAFGLLDSLIDNSITVVNSIGNTTANVAKMAEHSSGTLLAINILYTGDVLSKYADDELEYVHHVEPSLKLPTPKREFDATKDKKSKKSKSKKDKKNKDNSAPIPTPPAKDEDKDSDPEF